MSTEQPGHTYYFRAIFMRDCRGDLSRAEADLRQATRLRPDDDEYWEALADVLAAQDRFADLVELAVSRRNGETFAKSILLLLSAGQRQTLLAALDAYRKLRAENGFHSEYSPKIESPFDHNFRAMALYGLGDSELANRDADQYRQGAAALHHGFHMPGITVAVILVDPVAELNGTSAVAARSYGAASASVSSRDTSVFDRPRSITRRGCDDGVARAHQASADRGDQTV